MKNPMLIVEDNLSLAWGRLFLHTLGSHDRGPTVLSITRFPESLPREDESVAAALNETLSRHEKYTSEVSAMLIFPFTQWKRRRNSMTHQEFFTWYLEQFLPRLKSRDRKNARGTYFERMISFCGSRRINGKLALNRKDQLSQIICDWHRDAAKGRRSRRSSMQVTCFDPPKDHNGSALSGFPCLQQVGFCYDEAGGLAVNAYYPTQYVFDRAYGNYLGLAHLGNFMAHELGLKLVQVNCFIGFPELGRSVKKADLHGLRDLVERRLIN